MTDLIISSLPLQELTLHAYEALILSLKISIPFENDTTRLIAIKAEITQLEILVNHTREVIINNQ